MSASISKLQPTVYRPSGSIEKALPVWRAALQWLRNRVSPVGFRGVGRKLTGTRVTAAIAIALVTVTAGCGPRVFVAPRLDLTEFMEVGLIEFTVENAQGNLGQAATNRFAAELFAAQNGVAIVELGEAADVLREIDADNFNIAAYRLMGEVFEVPAVFVGHLEVSGVRPHATLRRVPALEARVSVRLTVRLVATDNGATLWSNSGRATSSVGEIGWVGGDPVFSAQNPDEAYGDLVDLLIWELTEDLRPTWRRDGGVEN